MAACNSSLYAVHYAIRKYGEETIQLIILASGVTWAQSVELETWWICRLGTFKGLGYNMTKGEGGVIEWTDEMRQKISTAQMSTPEARIKASEAIKRQWATLSPTERIERTAPMNTPEAIVRRAKAHTGQKHNRVGGS